MNRQEIIQTVLNSASVQSQIEARALKEKTSSAQVRKKAHSYCEEIFSSPSNRVVKVMQKLLSFFWNKFYSGTVVYGIDQVKQLSNTHQIVYVPCHRSHVDYLLLSYTIHQEGLDIPLIAAGNNLNMPIIGKILRGGGAFFIRRSFKGNALYTAVMQEYINQLVSHTKTMEYFIEGGRSRTGLLLKPKLGMLSMTLKAYLTHRTKPMAFVPIYIGYEKIIEGATYQKELSGKNKKKETFIGSLRSIARLRGQFGQVHVGIDTPIMLDDILSKNSEEWQHFSDSVSGKPEWYQKSLKQLAKQVMQGINRASKPNSANWIMTALMNEDSKAMTMSQLLETVASYQMLSQLLNDSIPVKIIDSQEVERVAQQGLISIESITEEGQVSIQQEQSELAQYYVNNTLHLLVLPSLLARLVLELKTSQLESLVEQVDLAFEPLQSHYFLTADSSKKIPAVLEYFQQQQLVSISKEQAVEVTADEDKIKRLTGLAKLIH